MPASQSPPIRLGVNIDHVATVRNARGGRIPIRCKAAEIAIAAGADGITAHLREDRRHIVDDDIARLKARHRKAAQSRNGGDRRRWSAIARKLRPHAACIVPERRAERTTEGGLDAAGQRELLARGGGATGGAGIRVSLFIAAEPAQIEAAAAIGAPVIEIHTGAWCDALAAGNAAAADAEFERIVRGARLRPGAGLEVHAGHGLDFVSAETIAALPEIVELNIGHFLIGEAMFDGSWPTRSRSMRAAMDRGRRAAAPRTGAHDPRHRLRHRRRAAHRQGDRAPWRPLPRPHLHRDRARQGRAAAQTGSKPTPSGSPPRRPAPRRWAPGCAPASGGATWASSICRRAGRRMDLTGGRQAAARRHHARRLRGAHRRSA